MEDTVNTGRVLVEDRTRSSQEDVESGSVSSRRSSRKSRFSRSSTSSRVSLEAARARAKAEAAKTRLTFTEKEGELKIERAKLEARIDYINQQKEAEAALVEAQVLESAAVEDLNESNPNKDFDFLPLPESASKRTDHYVTQHIVQHFPQEPKEKKNATSSPPTLKLLPVYSQNVQPELFNKTSDYLQSSTCQPNADCHQQRDNSCQHSFSPNNPTTDFAKFLAKSQLVSSGLTKFDDLPEHYQCWRETFINTVENLGLSASEEMDLLIKWLGKESGEHAIRIRSVNIKQPLHGLKMIWERLNKKYGAPEVIERALFCKIESFPKIHNRESQRLQELADLLTELDVAKTDGYLPGLAYLDTARGVQPIVEKLPLYLQDKWMSQGCKYKRDYGVAFPPFTFFKEFICREADERNDPSFNLSNLSVNPYRKPTSFPSQMKPVSVHKTNISSCTEPKMDNIEKLCPIHHKPHSLKNCRGFRKMLLEERKKFLKENNICFRCCASTAHQAKSCEVIIKCIECDSDKHLTALHPGPPLQSETAFAPPSENGGERSNTVPPNVTSKCTQVCGDGFQGKSCSKICLVNVYPEGHHELKKKVYVILDDQSNVSLAKTELFDMFSHKGASLTYTLKTCAGIKEATGRRADGFTVESLDGKVAIPLPTLIECNEIPNNRSEIPTPEAAYHHQHLKKIANQIPPLDPDADIVVLLGRDIIRAHKVRDQFNGPHNAPYAQRLDLGWVIVGDVCIGGAHKTSTVSVMKTCFFENGRPSQLSPCENQIQVKKNCNVKASDRKTLANKHKQNTSIFPDRNLGEAVFCTTESDNQLAHSIEDLKFLQIMEQDFHQDDEKSWVAPLPFRHPRRRLPNNRCYAHRRLMSLQKTLEKNPEKKTHFTEFMQKMLDKGHAELAPPLEKGAECWYLPTFGVYHPQKPNQIRVVFDSSAQYDGISLNDVLLSGPDLNNSLIGVLLRFRREPVAVTADIQQMFYCFVVREDCRDFLRFLWYKDNDFSKEVVDYRMRVHVFGNSPSPSVAIFGLRKAAEHQEGVCGRDARHFVERDFYVDDGLRSFTTEAEAIDVLHRTQQMLAASNIKLHKVASNRAEVMNAFPADQRADNIKDLNLSVDDLPVQRSLGISWNIMTDTFAFRIPESQKPFTRRGVLSTINSLFDPLGFIAPVTVGGRLILRELMTHNAEWDTDLPEDKKEGWRRWTESLSALEKLHIPRTYATSSASKAQHTELLIFSDASVKAISAVAYLKVINEQGQTDVGFVFGKSKLAPQPELTIPRLELCAAVLAVEIAELVNKEIDLNLNVVKFFTDSKVVLGYIHNETRRFYVYVNNRVQRIRQSTRPDQWNYIPSELNPADHGSRSVPAAELVKTTWLTGPTFLIKPTVSEVSGEDGSTYQLVDPDCDVDVRPEVTSLTTQVTEHKLDSKRFERFSSWSTLTKTVAQLRHITQSFSHLSKNQGCSGWHMCMNSLSVADIIKAEHIIIKSVQQEMFAEELKCIASKHDLPKTSALYKLQPVLDSEGMLRIGGRIDQAQLESYEAHPLIIPGRHHVASLLVRYHHESVKHQGRHFTEGAIRNSGLWIVGGKRLISRIIHECVTCRKLRGKTQEQQMSDLPPERLQVDPPFSYVGLDVFGPWEVVTRRTRGGQARDKRWAVLFTCMSTHAVHIEVIETLTSSSFINALRRFFSIRGHAKQLRSDCGTNFIGASRELKIDSQSSCDTSVEEYLLQQRCTWVFNPPHSSHMGGAWERMIGVARRILDSMLSQVGHSKLTHEILTTFMAEVSAIVNARPLIPVSTDPEAPFLLTPSMLLTQKMGSPPPFVSEFSKTDLLQNQWKRVQALAETFWARWRRDYLSTLQSRRKWQSKKPNLKEGDVVLMKDNQAKRNQWPMGLVVKAVPSKDGLVRKVEVKVIRNQTAKVFYRPVSEVVLLTSQQEGKSLAD